MTIDEITHSPLLIFIMSLVIYLLLLVQFKSNTIIIDFNLLIK